MQHDGAVGMHLHLGERGFGAGAEVLLHAGEAHAVAPSRMAGFEIGLLLRAVGPQRMDLGRLQYLIHADGAGGDRALRVLHARAQRVFQAELDRVELELLGEFVDHHLGGRHALQRAVAARRAGVDGARGDGHCGQVVPGEVIDRLRGGGAHHRHRGREVGAAAAVGLEIALEGLEQAGLPVHRDAVAHLEGVALDRGLELLVAVVGQPHRLAVGVKRGHQAVEGKVVVILGAVANGIAGMDEHLRDRERALGLGQHLRRALADFDGRLGRHHHVQRLGGGVIPAVGVVGLERGGVDRLRVVLALQHQPVRRRLVQLLPDPAGMVHALLAELAVILAIGPDRLVLAHHAGEQRRVLQAGEYIVVERGVAAHPHEAEGAPGIALERAGLGAVADDFVVELELVLGKAEAGEIVIDQDRHRMAEVGRRLAGRQQHVLAIEGGKGDTVAHQVGGGHHPVGFEIVAQQRQVEALEGAVRLGGAQDKGVRLLLRPVRHVARADIAGEDLVAGDLGHAVDAESGRAGLGVPLDRGQDLFFEQGREGLAADRCDVHRYPGDDAGFQESAARWAEVSHGISLKMR